MVFTIINKQYQFDSERFQYIIPDDKSLGPLTAWGAGRMLRKQTKEQEEFEATWNEKLTVSNESEGTKLIQIDGQTKVALDRDTKIESDHIRLWLRQVPKIADDNRLPTSTPKSPDQKWDYQPSKFLAYGTVKIDSPKLQGTAP